ncbi:MAG: FliM/FliN family flagellar motor switch protein [Treponema sp.]|nr:FliM/FliN family flagellar motor switch protein [Treponema sp.]
MNAEKTGNLIYEIRTRKNLTQKELAELINVSDKAVSKWERGEGCPDVSIMPNLAAALGIEVETLMNGEMPLTQDVSGKQIKEYNFRQPDRYSRNMQRDIWMLGDTICQKINPEFTAMIGERFEANVSCVDQMINIEFLRSIPQKCFFYDFSFAEGGLCIEIDGELGKGILKQDSKKYESINQYDLEVFKQFHLVSIAESLAGEICKRTENAIPGDLFAVKSAKAYGNSTTAMQEDNVMMLELSISCKVGNTQGFINLQFSEKMLANMMEANFFNEAASNRVKFQELSSIKHKHLSDNIFVEFGRYNPDAVELELGKILILDKKETEGLNVVYENRVIHTGKVMSIDDDWGVQITESVQLNNLIYDEEDYLSVQLGSAALSKEEISSLHQGSYVVLKQRAGELCKIIRSGKVIGTGEICIADDRFAIRIVECR